MTRPIDAGRVRRALERAVTPLGEQRYQVAGTDEPFYVVDLSSPTPCACRDAQIRGIGCLHHIAASLHDTNAALVPALRALLLPDQPTRRAS